MTAPANLGQRLADALTGNGADRAEIAGYLTGLLNDIALQSPEARRTIEHHIARQRAKALVSA